MVEVFQGVSAVTVIERPAGRLLVFGQGLKAFPVIDVFSHCADIAAAFIIGYPYVGLERVIHDVLIDRVERALRPVIRGFPCSGSSRQPCRIGDSP